MTEPVDERDPDPTEQSAESPEQRLQRPTAVGLPDELAPRSDLRAEILATTTLRPPRPFTPQVPKEVPVQAEVDGSAAEAADAADAEAGGDASEMIDGELDANGEAIVDADVVEPELPQPQSAEPTPPQPRPVEPATPQSHVYAATEEEDMAPSPNRESAAGPTGKLREFTAQRPEVALAVAFAGGIVIATILKHIARR